MRRRFGEFVFDSARRELICRGVVRHLSPKGYLLLDLLIERAPRVVTQDDLYKHVWGDVYVEKVNLPNLIAQVRAALGETRKSSNFIRTVHGYGYAFDADVLEESERSEREGLRRHADSDFLLQLRSEVFPLRNGANVVGRGEEADIEIESGSISRRHAVVTVNGKEVSIEDLGSKNGTFVCGDRVTSAAVEEGDEIRLGQITLVLRAARRDATTVTHTG